MIIGFGDVAQRLVRQLNEMPSRRALTIYALIRRAESAPKVQSLGVRPVLGDLDDFRSLHRLAGLGVRVLYFAPPPSAGTTDPRLQRALAVLAATARQFVYVSTTGVYGDHRGAWVSETTPVRPESARAKRRVDAEQQLRRRGQLASARLRAPGIYAEDRLPLERIQRGTPAIISEEDSYSNHIHAEDLARAGWLALFRAKSHRAYNVTDGIEIKMGEWFDRVADAHGLPRVPKVPSAQIQASVTPESWSFMRESRRIGNARMGIELRISPRSLRPTG